MGSTSGTTPAELAAAIRVGVIERAYAAGVGHVGSALSIADMVAAVFAGVIRTDGPPGQRERFVLGKGHAALALYVALYKTGRIDRAALESYCADGTALGTHPEVGVAGIDFSTGSLGHGLPYGVGSALAGAIAASTRRTFVLLSDAELNEGSTWEAVMFAAHHRLSRLVVLVDVNGQQALGATRDVLDLEPLADRWRAFGWDAVEVDGHNPDAIVRVLSADPAPATPRVLLCRTTTGRGVSFMEGELKWHYWPLSDSEYRIALADLLHKDALAR